MKKYFILLLISIQSGVFAHDIDYGKIILKEWTLTPHNEKISASLYMYKNGEVYLEDAQNRIIHYPISSFSIKDQEYVSRRYASIEKMNNLNTQTGADKKSATVFTIRYWIICSLLAALGLFIFFTRNKSKRKFLSPVFYAGLLMMLYSFNDPAMRAQLLTTTDPAFVDSAFIPFKPKVHTHWDATYFYVESKGIPDHTMMVGITAWQQQVPIPQCYTTANNNNAWSIPLNPVIADTPVPVNQQHFLRGAVAIAVNGVAIFNPYTNTGVDAFLDGQLDNFGGHCGRADDYHYHIAPLHLYGQTAVTLPIAFALDGFAVYGAYEPDGSPMTTLDTNHGHLGADGRYHYHGTAAAPYMIGKMVGKVTEDNTLQIIPQAAAKPIRPFLQPLSGAVITGCVTNNSNNGYNLTYTRSGQTYQVNYNWVDYNSSSSQYTFHFISPGSSADSVYIGFSQSQCTVPNDSTTQTGESKTMLRLPDTGENSSYTSTPGEDADYTFNTPFFVNNNNGTITDTVTGLMWQRTDGGEMTFENAIAYCDTLTLGGYTDWRLPDAHEGFSILNMQFANPAIDTNYFTPTNADYWWSSTRQLNDTTKIWATNAGGGVGNKPKSETISAGGTFRYHVRAVRNIHTPAVVLSRFTDNNNGTITDNFTSLIWQKIPFSDSLTWENALLYADTLSTAGITSWRLPNIKELQSLNNEKRMNPSIDTQYVHLINNKKYWSSTTLSNHTTQAWYLNTRFGITSYDNKTVRNPLVCVTGRGDFTYLFNGNGNWNTAGNWLYNIIPPALLPAGYSIIIDPVTGGQCLLNTTQHISKGAAIEISNGKSLVVPGLLQIQ